MRVNDALGQIAQIHDHLARAEQYRGFHPIEVAATGLIGLLAATAQKLVFALINPFEGPSPRGFALYWLAVAAIAGGVGVAPAVATYVYHEDEFARRRTRRLAGQFLPCVIAGFCVTLAVIRDGNDSVNFLPGIWSLLFGLGVFAARPFLPRTIGWVGLFYLVAGAGLLALPITYGDAAGWLVGGVFLFGQGATALVLHRNQERDADA
jgi:hypothetical protein